MVVLDRAVKSVFVVLVFYARCSEDRTLEGTKGEDWTWSLGGL